MRLLLLALLALLAGCGDVQPQYGTLTLGQESPRATLTGHSGGSRSAIDLGPGCTGFVSPDGPNHVFVLPAAMKLDVTARSTRGPISLAIVGESETICDADEGTGHEPHLQIVTPGRYQVYVGSLASADELPYDLTVGPEQKDDETPGGGGGGHGEIPLAVTVTSTPPGATVRTAGGQVLGTTPAMFVWPVATAQATQPQSFVVEVPGGAPTTVTGTPTNGELVLHATLSSVATPVTPTGTEVRSTGAAVPIRDFSSVSLTADMPTDCQLAGLDVDVSIHHSYVSDLQVSLVSPGGTSVTLHNHRGAGRRNLIRTFRSSERASPLRQLAGQAGRGTWTLTVRDTVEADTGTLDNFVLHLQCVPPGTASASPTPTNTLALGTPPTITSGIAPNGFRNPFASLQIGSAIQPPAPIAPIPAPRHHTITGNEVLDPWGP